MWLKENNLLFYIGEWSYRIHCIQFISVYVGNKLRVLYVLATGPGLILAHHLKVKYFTLLKNNLDSPVIKNVIANSDLKKGKWSLRSAS